MNLAWGKIIITLYIIQARMSYKFLFLSLPTELV